MLLAATRCKLITKVNKSFIEHTQLLTKLLINYMILISNISSGKANEEKNILESVLAKQSFYWYCFSCR